VTLDQRPFASGWRVVRHLALALVATAVAPPLLAWGLNAQREAQTRRMMEGSVHSQSGAGPAGVSGDVAHVACGSGAIPDIDQQTASDRGLAQAWMNHQGWLAALGQAAARQQGLPKDAWDHCILMRAGGGAAAVMLSAGANGLIETPLDASVPDGDDILVTVD